MGVELLLPPALQLFVNGRHLGDGVMVFNLNEAGELGTLLKDFQVNLVKVHALDRLYCMTNFHKSLQIAMFALTFTAQFLGIGQK